MHAWAHIEDEILYKSFKAWININYIVAMSLLTVESVDLMAFMCQRPINHTCAQIISIN